MQVRTVCKLGVFRFKTDIKLRDRKAYEVKMRMFNLYDDGYYNGSFQTVGNYLKVIISYQF